MNPLESILLQLIWSIKQNELWKVTCYHYSWESFHHNDNSTLIEYSIMVTMYVLLFESYKTTLVLSFRNMDSYDQQQQNHPLLEYFFFFFLSLRVHHRNMVDWFCFSVMVNRNNAAVVSWESERHETVTLRGV